MISDRSKMKRVTKSGPFFEIYIYITFYFSWWLYILTNYILQFVVSLFLLDLYALLCKFTFSVFDRKLIQTKVSSTRIRIFKSCNVLDVYRWILIANLMRIQRYKTDTTFNVLITALRTLSFFADLIMLSAAHSLLPEWYFL